MPNDVSYFKVQGDNTQYSFNDADLENLVGSVSMGTTATTVTGAIAEHESDISTLNTGKAPNNHASTASTYGLGTTGNYGHVKTVNGLTTAAHADGLALSAYQGKVLNDSITTLNSKLTIEQIGSEVTYTPTATNTWVQVFSVTITKPGMYYLVTTYNARCIGLGFNSSTTISGAPDYGYQTSDLHIYKTPMFYLPAGTYYVFGMFNSTTVANRFWCYRYG